MAAQEIEQHLAFILGQAVDRGRELLVHEQSLAYAHFRLAGPDFGGIFPSLAFGTPPGQPLLIRALDTENAYAAYAQGT